MTREQMKQFLFLLNLYANGNYNETSGLLKQCIKENNHDYSSAYKLFNGALDIKYNIDDILNEIQANTEYEECLDEYYENQRMQCYNA